MIPTVSRRDLGPALPTTALVHRLGERDHREFTLWRWRQTLADFGRNAEVAANLLFQHALLFGAGGQDLARTVDARAVDRPGQRMIALASPFDLERREGDTITFTKRRISGRRLAIDPYQVVVRLEVADMPLEHLLGGCV